MGRTKTAGIQTGADGSKIVDKRAFGVRIKRRLGKIDQEQAEAWLAKEVEALRQAKLFGARPERTFREAAVRYLSEHPEQACLDEVAWHLKLLDPWIGELALKEIHDATLAPFVRKRAETVSATTVRRSLEVVRRILNLAARKWREEDARPGCGPRRRCSRFRRGRLGSLIRCPGKSSSGCSNDCRRIWHAWRCSRPTPDYVSRRW
jgi:hypothetical protein